MSPGHRRRGLVLARWWLAVLAGVAALLVPVQLRGTASAQGGVPGTLDPTFDTDGTAINELVSSFGQVTDSVLLPDGKVLVVADDRVWRLMPDGTPDSTFILDRTFDRDGVLLPFPSGIVRPNHIALRPPRPGQPDTGFVVTTGRGSDGSCPAGRVAEFDQNGVPDPDFAPTTGGVACINFPNFDGLVAVTVQADGRIVVVGSSQAAGAARHMALARLSADGAQTVNTISQPFGTDISFESGQDMAVQADGNIVVAASTTTIPNVSQIGVALFRYRGDTLALDTTFGGGDGVNVENTFLDASDNPIRLALQPDGQGMSVAVGGSNRPDPAAPPIPTIEQLLMNQNGILSDSPVDIPLTGRSSVWLDDLTATATGYVATAHFSDTAPPTAPDGMVAVPLAQEFTEPTPLDIAPATAQLPIQSARSVLLPDGKVLIASAFNGPAGGQMLLNRLIEDTTTDPRTLSLDPTLGTSFGLTGFRTLNGLTSDTGQAVVVQPDSKVLVGGLSSGLSAGFVLRHNEDGALDATFGGPRRPGVAFLGFKVNGVARASDGRVVAAGSRFIPGDGDTVELGAVQRLLDSGAPDPAWNKGQPTFVNAGADLPGTFFRDAAVQPDGGVVAVGDVHGCNGVECTPGNSIIVARFTAGGILDDSFGDGGLARIGNMTGDEVALAQGRGIALQPDGKIVVTGNLGTSLVLARLLTGGGPDPTFAAPAGPFGPGVLADDLLPGTGTDRGLGRDVALRPDGRIVVAGDLVTRNCNQVVACFTRINAIVAQYGASGARDGSFGTGGLAQPTTAPSEGHGVAVDGAGNVLVAGTAALSGGTDVLLARLSSAGVPDPQFGTNGVVLTDVDQNDAANGMDLAPDGKIVVAGTNSDTRGNRVLTARYEPGGVLHCKPSPLNFGPVVQGTGALTLPVTCTNTGPSRLTITSVTAAGANAGDFVPAAGDCLRTLVPGESCQIPVAFTPGGVGPRTAALSVAHTAQDDAGPVSVELKGTGIARDSTLNLAPIPVNFPEQLGLTTSPAKTVTVSNRGTVPVVINTVTIENGSGDFAIGNPGCTNATLRPGGGLCVMSVTFTPRAPGRRTATLRLDDGAGVTHRLPLAGTGATPTMLINPGVGRPGTVTVSTGAKFPPGRPITLTWADPLTLLGGFPEPAATVTSNPDGTLTANALIFPGSRVGGRVLIARIGAFTANAPFLVSPGAAQPPNFIYRR